MEVIYKNKLKKGGQSNEEETMDYSTGSMGIFDLLWALCRSKFIKSRAYRIRFNLKDNIII
ncbi:MAG: hypothetical protein H9W82_03515 [Lactobacillus sp.]|nr:hypothetical protein [Lactobacillus sp.]